MTVSAHTEQAESLLRELICRFISFPHHLELERKAFRGAASWTITCHPDDYGKINGKGGTHLRALEFLVYRLGVVNGEAYGLRLVDSEFRISGGDRPQQGRYLPEEDIEQLSAWLTALALECSVVTWPKSDGFVFSITPRGPRDYGELIAVNSLDTYDRSLVGCLGTIFRAIGRAAGVDLVIEVKQP